MSTTSETIAVRVRDLRAAHKMTLQEVADSVGCVRSWVWEIENGKGKNPTIDMAVKLARCFGVSLDYLAGLSAETVDLHPEALRIACEVDALLRRITTADASLDALPSTKGLAAASLPTIADPVKEDGR